MNETEILRISEILKAQGMSSKELAERVGLHAVTISSIVNNKAMPSKDNLIKIAEALDVGISELFIGTPIDKEAIYKKNEDGNFEAVGYLNK